MPARTLGPRGGERGGGVRGGGVRGGGAHLVLLGVELVDHRDDCSVHRSAALLVGRGQTRGRRRLLRLLLQPERLDGHRRCSTWASTDCTHRQQPHLIVQVVLVDVAAVEQQLEEAALGSLRHVDRFELACLEAGALVRIQRKVAEPRVLHTRRTEGRRRHSRRYVADEDLDARGDLELVREHLDLLQCHAAREAHHKCLRKLAPPRRLPATRLRMEVLQLAHGVPAVLGRDRDNVVRQ